MDQGFPYYNYPNPNPNYIQLPPPPPPPLPQLPPPLARDFILPFPYFHPPPNPYTHSHPTMPPILPQRPPQPQPQPRPHPRSRSKPKPQPTPNHHHQLAHSQHQPHQHQHLAKQHTIHLQAERRAVLDALKTATATRAQLAAALQQIQAENERWKTPNANLAAMYRLHDEMARAEREGKECHRRWDELGEEVEEKHLEIAFGESGSGGGGGGD